MWHELGAEVCAPCEGAPLEMLVCHAAASAQTCVAANDVLRSTPRAYRQPAAQALRCKSAQWALRGCSTLRTTRGTNMMQ